MLIKPFLPSRTNAGQVEIQNVKLAELVEARLDPFHARCLVDSIDTLDIADAESL